MNSSIKELLESRKKGQKDKRKLGLVIQGGGMRGAFSGGVVNTLEKLGYTELFDSVYASSSGALTAAYFLTSQTEAGCSIYWEDLPYFRFIQPWNLKKSMNLDFLVDGCMCQRKPLDFKKLKKVKTVLNIFVTNINTGMPEAFNNHMKDVDLNNLFKATCAYPGHYPPVVINDNLYLDGNLSTILPIEFAIKDGCTDLLVITTVPRDYVERKSSATHLLLNKIYDHDLPSILQEVRLQRFKQYNSDLKSAFESSVYKGANIFTISPNYLISNASVLAGQIKKFDIHGREVSRLMLA